MSTKEIITLQLGHYANFIGSHWWNIQESHFEYGNAKTNGIGSKEEIDHDVLFREGVTSRGEITFTPRLVLTELKGGLGTLRPSGILYEDVEPGDLSTQTWDGKTRVYKQPEAKKNKYLTDLDNPKLASSTVENLVPNGDDSHRTYSLEKDVKVWSDYLRTFLHPKSTVIINDYQHDSQNDPFDFQTKGANLKQTIEELEERVRFYAEECDLLQGFHVLSDSDNGFTGLSSSFMPYLHDEFSSKCIASFPVHPATYCNDTTIKANKRKLNDASSLPVFLEHSSIVCPLSLDSGTGYCRAFPHLIYDVNLSYHTSAILASALDTFSINYRLKGNMGTDMSSFCDQLLTSSKNLVGASLLMPLSMDQPSRTREFFSNDIASDPWTYITPGIDTKNSDIVEHYANSMTIRGISLNETRNPRIGQVCFSGLFDFQSLFQLYLDMKFRGSKNHANIRQHPMKTMAPFPQVFSNEMKANCTSHEHCQNGHRQTENGHQSVKINLQSLNCEMNGNATHAASKPSMHEVPILAGMETSSRLSAVFRLAAANIRLGGARELALHWTEPENLESDIEYLLTQQDEYKQVCNSDTDSDQSL